MPDINPIAEGAKSLANSLEQSCEVNLAKSVIKTISKDNKIIFINSIFSITK